MSKFVILKRVRPGPWTEDGEITVGVDHIVAIEDEPGGAGQHTRLTLSGGREICIKGNHKMVRRSLVQVTRSERGRQSLWEEVFGHKANEAWVR